MAFLGKDHAEICKYLCAMTSLLGQQDLERWLGDTKNTSQKLHNRHLGVAGSLHQTSLRLLISLGRKVRERKDVPSSLLHGYLNEIERFFLWGDGISAAEEERGLDSVLDRSSEIRTNVLSLLYEIGVAAQCKRPQIKHPSFNKSH